MRSSFSLAATRKNDLRVLLRQSSHYGLTRGLANYGLHWPLVFVNKSFTVTQPCTLTYLLPMAALQLQWQSSWHWEHNTCKPKIFTIRPFEKKSADPEAITNKLEFHKPCPLARMLLSPNFTDVRIISNQKYSAIRLQSFRNKNGSPPSLQAILLPGHWSEILKLISLSHKQSPALKKQHSNNNKNKQTN